MKQCFYCQNGKVVTPPGIKSFEEFADCTTVMCKRGRKTGCAYCPEFKDVDEMPSQARKEATK